MGKNLERGWLDKQGVYSDTYITGNGSQKNQNTNLSLSETERVLNK